MPTVSNILLPVDFSERSLGAAQYAKVLAERYRSEITLLHVVTPVHYEFGALEGCAMLGEIYADRVQQAQDNLDQFLQEELARCQTRRFLLGSNTASVLHDAECPVWTGVHIQDARQAGPIAIRKVLCAIDLGPQSCRTLTWAGALQREFDAKMTVMHALAYEDQADEELEASVRAEV